jgi:regulatory protein
MGPGRPSRTAAGTARRTAERPAPKPLDAAHLRDLALQYVGKYATSEAKLRRYLTRKLWERGWEGEGSPPVDTVVARLADLGYVDDRVFAEARGRGLSGRGFGARRVSADLGAAGIDRDLASEVAATGDPMAAAIAFARRRRFGPYDTNAPDPDRRRKQFAAMMRAGHGVAETRRVLAGDLEE